MFPKAAAKAVIVAALLALALPARALKIELLSAAEMGTLGSGGKVSAGSIQVVAGRVLVKFQPSIDHAQKKALLDPLGHKIAGELSKIGWTVVDLAPGTRVGAGLQLLRGLPGILAVAPDYVYRAHATPNDPDVPQQYGLSQIDAFGAWSYATAANSTQKVTVAVIDSGIDGTQPDLSGQIATNGNAYFNPDPQSANGGLGPTIVSTAAENPPTGPIAACYHGTFVSGIAAASTNNGYEIAGVSWGAQLLSLRVFNQSDCNPDCSDTDPNCVVDGGNCCETDDVAISSAILYAANLQKTPAYGNLVINMSLGGTGTCSSVAADAIAVATGAAIPVVIAAGNDGPGGDTIEAPANCAGTSLSGGVIPVGATDQNNNLASFSSTGQELAANGVVAPGVGILSTTLSSSTATGDGTSFATPHVAGLAALILSAKPICGGQNCAAYVQNTIRNSADNIGLSPNYQGAGRINAFKALRLSTQGTLSNYAGQQEPIAFPNPFRIAQENNLSFSIPPSLAGASPTIKIYTVGGQLVKEITGLTWDGRNSSGNLVASGTYIFLVQTSQGEARGRFSVIH